MTNSKTEADLLAEISKKAGEKADYLEKDRAYRSELDVFDHYTAEERDSMFSVPPSTVWENFSALKVYAEKKKNLADTFIEGNDGSISKMSTEDILELFTI